MKTVEGYNVKIYTDNIEDSACEQIKELLSIDVFSKCKIRIMPDVHAGAGCVIGFTGDLGDKVIPNIVGVDIGCGILVQPFVCTGNIDYHALNEFILHYIPSGRNYRDNRYAPLPHLYMDVYREAKDIIKQLRCYRELKETKRLNASIGSLGGGNHFIELDKDECGMTYLVVHTKDELQDAIRQLHNSFKMRKPTIPPDLSYLEGAYREDYLHDMRLCQHWAKMNRSLIANLIMDYFICQGNVELKQNELAFESVHNYIGDDNIIRKGAIAAYEGQKCIIPLNMRDGSLICIGKGNADWNCSAPHGAGRIMSRSQAFKSISMDDYRASMLGIYSESLSEDTKDESPMVYKPKDEIIGNIRDTVSIVNVIKPIYNFKAAE